MSLFSGISFVLGMIIGSGIFASPGPVLQYTGGNIGLSLFVWIFSGILAILGGLCYAELGTRMPKSGGEHPYMMAAYAGVEGDEIHGYKTSTAVGDDDSFHEVAIEKRVRGWGSLPSFLFTWTGAVATRPGRYTIISYISKSRFIMLISILHLLLVWPLSPSPLPNTLSACSVQTT